MTEKEQVLNQFSLNHQRFVEEESFKIDIEKLIDKRIKELSDKFDWKMYRLEKRLSLFYADILINQAKLVCPGHHSAQIRYLAISENNDIFEIENALTIPYVSARVKLRKEYEEELRLR